MPSEPTPMASSAWSKLLEGDIPATGADWNPIQQRALLVNRLAILLALLANVVIMGSFFVIGDSVPLGALGLMLLSTVAYCICYLLLQRGKIQTSRALFSVSLLTTVLFLTLILGTLTWTHAFYLPIAVGGPIVWPRNARGIMFLGAAGTLLFFGLEFFGPPVGIADLTVPEATLSAMAWFYIGLTVVLTGTIMLLNSLTSIVSRTCSTPSTRRSRACSCRFCPPPWPMSSWRPGSMRPAGSPAYRSSLPTSWASPPWRRPTRPRPSSRCSTCSSRGS